MDAARYTNGLEADTVTATNCNRGFNAEATIETSALPAEASGGVTVNRVNKDGSNLFKGDLYSSYTLRVFRATTSATSRAGRGWWR
jgi:hypothetical protein